jgi:isoleucyl-tRNA synthetase
VRVSDNILNQVAEIYRRIRNTLFKFCLANISDFNYKTNRCEEYSEVDLFILNQLSNNVKKINEAYEKYDFATVVRTINSHVIELSG